MNPNTRRLWLGLGATALAVALLAPFASQAPDTLEHAVGDRAPESPANIPAPMPGYRIPGLGASYGSKVVAGIAGIVAVVLLVRILVRPRRRSTPE